jgi:antitoxin HicB
MSKMDTDYYMGLPYKVEIVPDEEGEGFHASIPDLRGCMAFGETIETALNALSEVKRAWIEIALEEGWRIPEPATDEVKDYSGRFNVRLPRYLHGSLARLAQVQGTSLNQLVVSLLAEGTARIEGRTTSEEAQAECVDPGPI